MDLYSFPIFSHFYDQKNFLNICIQGNKFGVNLPDTRHLLSKLLSVYDAAVYRLLEHLQEWNSSYLQILIICPAGVSDRGKSLCLRSARTPDERAQGRVWQASESAKGEADEHSSKGRRESTASPEKCGEFSAAEAPGWGKEMCKAALSALPAGTESVLHPQPAGHLFASTEVMQS